MSKIIINNIVFIYFNSTNKKIQLLIIYKYKNVIDILMINFKYNLIVNCNRNLK